MAGRGLGFECDVAGALLCCVALGLFWGLATSFLGWHQVVRFSMDALLIDLPLDDLGRNQQINYSFFLSYCLLCAKDRYASCQNEDIRYHDDA